MDLRRRFGEAAQPVRHISRCENHHPFDSLDERRGDAAVVATGVDGYHGRNRQASSLRVLETHALTSREVGLTLYPFLVSEASQHDVPGTGAIIDLYIIQAGGSRPAHWRRADDPGTGGPLDPP